MKKEIYQIGKLDFIDLSKLLVVGKINNNFDSGIPGMNLIFEMNSGVFVRFDGYTLTEAEEEREKLIKEWEYSKI